ncbi:MAG: signal peptidase II [Candidatus Sumerlaeaceae bacterium]|nr:signal peptidase II [Candidatus Sumerlaeaceae bacterium]
MLAQTRKSALARLAWFYGAALLVAVVDQWSKHVIWHWLGSKPAHRVTVVPGLFDLFLQFNPGGAFSLFHDRPMVILVFALAAVVWMLWHVHRLSAQQWLEHLALGLIIGGATGNLIDRFRLGFVVDFFHVYWRQWYWPTFNVADSAICVGVALYIYAVLSPSGRRSEHQEEHTLPASENPKTVSPGGGDVGPREE